MINTGAKPTDESNQYQWPSQQAPVPTTDLLGTGVSRKNSGMLSTAAIGFDQGSRSRNAKLHASHSAGGRTQPQRPITGLSHALELSGSSF